MSGIGPQSRLGIRYTAERPEDHDRFHRDLRIDYDVTRRNALKSRGFLDAHTDCAHCASIRDVGGDG